MTNNYFACAQLSVTVFLFLSLKLVYPLRFARLEFKV